MGFMSKFFSSLGFESDESTPQQPKKKKEKKAKASYKLKKNENVEKIDNIDGVSVFYPVSIEDCKEYLPVVKAGEAIIINVDYAENEDKDKIIAYCTGAVDMIDGKISILEGERYYILLPEGMEIEE